MIESTPLCVVLDGPPAVGQSTLATAIQDHSVAPLLRFGVDELYRMVPDQWAGGVKGARFTDRGFTYQEVTSIPGARRINNGVDAISLLHAMNAAVLGVLTSGVGVVVDGQTFEPSVNQDLENRLRDLQARGVARVAIIELAANDTSLTHRQRRHAHPAGLSLHQNVLPRQASTPDLVLDTTGLTADEVADRVCGWLDQTFGTSQRSPSLSTWVEAPAP